jgi:hypothetical protein
LTLQDKTRSGIPFFTHNDKTIFVITIDLYDEKTPSKLDPFPSPEEIEEEQITLDDVINFIESNDD